MRVKSPPFKLWQVLAIPCSIASFFFHFTPSVMHKHCRIKQTAAAAILSYFHRMSVNNNPVSSKRNHGYHSTNNVIIAHARMRTPTEELEYACLAAWFHSSTCNLFFCVCLNKYSTFCLEITTNKWLHSPFSTLNSAGISQLGQ